MRQVDSSLIDEWEKLINPEPDDLAPDSRFSTIEAAPRDVTQNERAFAVMVRNEAFRWVQLLDRRNTEELTRVSDPDHASDLERAPSPLRSGEQIGQMVDSFWKIYDDVATGPDARSPELFQLGERAGSDAEFAAQTAADEGDETVAVRQVIVDPENNRDYALTGWVDLGRSRQLGRAVLVFDRLGQI